MPKQQALEWLPHVPKSGTAKTPGASPHMLHAWHLQLCGWGLLASDRVADASTGCVLPPSVPITALTGVRLASLGTKVPAAEADIPYAGTARRATLSSWEDYVVHHRR